MTMEMVRSGKALVSLERNRVNRALSRLERNETWRSSAMGASKEGTANWTSPAQMEMLGGGSDLGEECDDSRPIVGGGQANNGNWTNLEVILYFY